jgi:hypothetical protein
MRKRVSEVTSCMLSRVIIVRCDVHGGKPAIHSSSDGASVLLKHPVDHHETTGAHRQELVEVRLRKSGIHPRVKL